MVAGYRTSGLGLLFLLALPAFVSTTSEVHTVTPIEKVVLLLKKLSAQITEEGKVEAAEYDKYACFCKEQADEKTYAIETSEKKIAAAKAKEDELKKTISALNQDISDLSKKINGLEGDIKTATDKRAAEAAEYEKQAKDLNDAVSACERAIESIKEAKADIAANAGKVDLAQLSASSPLLAAALAQSKQAPASYQVSSNEILGILEGLLDKFKSNKAELDETEFHAKGAFELKTQAMSNQKGFAEKEKFENEEQAESLGETLADTTSEKQDETKAMEADKDFRKVLEEECRNKAIEFDQRSSTRADEVTAITKALEDLEKNAMGNYKATGLADLQKKAAPLSFLQLRSPSKASLLVKASGASRIAATQNVLELLLKKVTKSHSPVLASVTMKLTLLEQDGIDHFVKVRQLIKDLLKKLDADAKSEATQKAYCDKNMKTQTENRDSATLTIEEKDAAIKIAEADKAAAKERIAELEAGISENMKGLNEAGELREEEKATNLEAIRMADEGKKSVDFAIQVLNEFYSKKALIQKEVYTPPNADRSGKTVGDMAPAGFSGTYRGNQAASKGIIGILEVIAADFERTSTAVDKEETENEKKYQDYKKTTEEDNDAKNKEIKLKEKTVSDLTDKLVTLTDDKMAAEKNLESALTTLEDLKKMCVDAEETYEERVAKRKEEIDALKDAMSILENWKQ